MKILVSSILLISLLTGCSIFHPRTPAYGVGPGKVYHSSQAYLQKLGKTKQELAAKPTCCLKLNEIIYEKAKNIPSDLSLKLNLKTQVYNFKSGNSYVRGVELPRSNDDYRVRLTSSHITDGIAVTTGGFLYPAILILDENFEVLEKHDKDSFQFYSKEGFGFQTNSGLRSELDISGSLISKAKYLLVYTTNSLMEKKTNYLFGGGRVYKSPETAEEIRKELANSIYWLVVAPNIPTGVVKLEFFH